MDERGDKSERGPEDERDEEPRETGEPPDEPAAPPFGGDRMPPDGDYLGENVDEPRRVN